MVTHIAVGTSEISTPTDIRGITLIGEGYFTADIVPELFFFVPPIRVGVKRFDVSVYNMEVGKPYNFRWAGVEFFAIRRSTGDNVDIYAIVEDNDD